MSKKELLARIEHLEKEVGWLKAELDLLRMDKSLPNPYPPGFIPQPAPCWQPTYATPYIVTCGTKTGG